MSDDPPGYYSYYYATYKGPYREDSSNNILRSSYYSSSYEGTIGVDGYYYDGENYSSGYEGDIPSYYNSWYNCT